MVENVTAQNAPDWISWITNFDNTRKLYLDNWWALKNMRPWVVEKHPELLAQHDAIMQKFLDQVPTIDNLQRVRDQVDNFFRGLGIIGQGVQNVLNFTGIQSGIDWLKGTFGFSGYSKESGLGFVQVIAVAVGIAAATAALITIAKMVTDAGLYSQRLAALKEMEDRGYTPQQAADVVNQVVGAPGTSITPQGDFLGLPVNQLLIGAVALVLGPPIIAAISGRRK